MKRAFGGKERLICETKLPSASPVEGARDAKGCFGFRTVSFLKRSHDQRRGKLKVAARFRSEAKAGEGLTIMISDR